MSCRDPASNDFIDCGVIQMGTLEPLSLCIFAGTFGKISCRMCGEKSIFALISGKK